MSIALWIVQVLLALAFFLAGMMKLTQPKKKLAERMGWVEDFSPATIKAIGALELLGALGVVLPALTGMLPILTPVAAIGLVFTMIGAALTHLRRKEYPNIVSNVVLSALAAIVVVGRWESLV